MKAGIALNPSETPEDLLPVLPYVELVLVMSIEPGFSGQAFIPHSLDTVAKGHKRLLSVRGSKGGPLGHDRSPPATSRPRAPALPRRGGNAEKNARCRRAGGKWPGSPAPASWLRPPSRRGRWRHRCPHEPERYIPRLGSIGVDYVTFHRSATPFCHRVVLASILMGGRFTSLSTILPVVRYS